MPLWASTIAPMLTPDDALYVIKPWLLALLLPPTPGLLLMLAGAFSLRRRWLGRGLLLAGFAFSWFSCTEWLASVLQSLLLKPPPALSAAQVVALADRPGTAVLVLGGGSRADVPELASSPDLNELSLQRLRYGVWLARRLHAPLGFSGGVAPLGEKGRLPEAQLAQRVATEEFGLPLRWAEGNSRNTLENARLSLPLLQAAGVKRVVLVTHVMHLPRSLRAFQAQASGGIEVIPAGIDYRADGPSSWGDYLPGTPGFKRNRYVWTEWLGLLSGH